MDEEIDYNKVPDTEEEIPEDLDETPIDMSGATYFDNDGHTR